MSTIKPIEPFFAVPDKNGLNEIEEARFRELYRKWGVTKEEDKEFKRLRRKRWQPDMEHDERVKALADDLLKSVKQLLHLYVVTPADEEHWTVKEARKLVAKAEGEL